MSFRRTPKSSRGNSRLTLNSGGWSDLRYRIKGILTLLVLLLLIILFVGPCIPIPALQTTSLKAREQITTMVQTRLITPIQDQLSQIEINNPIQTAVDRRSEDYATAVEAITGEPPPEDETCIALFGLIPLNCPDPSGEGVITADPREDLETECIQLFGLTPIQCRDEIP